MDGFTGGVEMTDQDKYAGLRDTVLLNRKYKMSTLIVKRDEIESLLADHARLVAENERLAKDAARYQWLRHGDNDEAALRPLDSGEIFLLRNRELDEVIDAALSTIGGDQ